MPYTYSMHMYTLPSCTEVRERRVIWAGVILVASDPVFSERRGSTKNERMKIRLKRRIHLALHGGVRELKNKRKLVELQHKTCPPKCAILPQPKDDLIRIALATTFRFLKRRF